MRRYWEYLWPARLLRSLHALAGGARVHPGAMLCGRTSQVRLGRGAIVSSRCVLRPSGRSQIVVGASVWLARDVELGTDTLLHIGPRTTLQRRCTVYGSARIGADCILAPDVFISSGTHPFRHLPHLPIREQERRLAAEGVSLDLPVWIQDDCWLGTHVVVSPGVTIGKGSVIGANSVVTRDVPPYSVMAGSPARRIAQRLDWDPPERLDTSKATDWPYILTGTGDPATGLRMSPGEPLLVAVRGSELRIGLECPKSSSLLVNGQAFDLSPGTNQLDVRAAAADAMGATLRIEASDPPAGLVFTSFASLP